MRKSNWPAHLDRLGDRLRIHSTITLVFLASCLGGSTSLAWATTFTLPGDGKRLIGEVRSIIVQKEDTLLDIARQFGLGFNEITAANPGIDPWLPEEGVRVVLPTQFILPATPREGIVVNLAEMRLYYFPEPENGRAREVVTYPIGIGRQGWETPTGDYHVTLKLENPSWTMPDSVYEEAVANGAKPNRLIPPGPNNPLGEYAMQLDDSGLLIHGTNMPFSIGMRVSRGCLRLYPEDIRSLVGMVPKGTTVRIVEQAYKISNESGTLYLEAHEPVGFNRKLTGLNLTPVISAVVASGIGQIPVERWEDIVNVAGEHSGVPVALKINRPEPMMARKTVVLPYPFP